MWVTSKEMKIKDGSWSDKDLIHEIMNSEGLSIWFGFNLFHCISNFHHIKTADILFYTSTISKNFPEMENGWQSFHILNCIHPCFGLFSYAGEWWSAPCKALLCEDGPSCHCLPISLSLSGVEVQKCSCIPFFFSFFSFFCFFFCTFLVNLSVKNLYFCFFIL